MKAKKITQSVKSKLILGALFLLTNESLMAQASTITTKATNLTNLILQILNIILTAVAAGAFIWMVIGIFTKAQDIKQRVIYFVIGVVLMGLQSTIVSSLMGL
jgi:uncharacterized membrane protein YczE